MNVETYFEEQKGITVDDARNAGAKYTAIDICRFAKNYHEREVENLDIQRVSQQSELLKEIFDLTAGAWDDPVISEDLYNRIEAAISFNCG